MANIIGQLPRSAVPDTAKVALKKERMSPHAQKCQDSAQQCLQRHSHRSGGILYSSLQTLCPDDVYFMGLNLGGEGGTGPKLKDGIAATLTRTNNAYLVKWDNALDDDTGQCDWNLKAFQTIIQGREVAVVGLPHLSRYGPTVPVRGKKVIDWIQKFRGRGGI